MNGLALHSPLPEAECCPRRIAFAEVTQSEWYLALRLVASLAGACLPRVGLQMSLPLRWGLASSS